jgi:hypothetical protein
VLNLWFVVRYERRLTTDTRTKATLLCVFPPLVVRRTALRRPVPAQAQLFPFWLIRGREAGVNGRKRIFGFPSPVRWSFQSANVSYKEPYKERFNYVHVPVPIIPSRISATVVIRIAIIFFFFFLSFLRYTHPFNWQTYIHKVLAKGHWYTKIPFKRIILVSTLPSEEISKS